MDIITFPCGHRVTYYRIKPLRCTTCRTERHLEMGRAHSERVHEEKEMRERRYAAENAHSWGREHERAICPLCRAGANFTIRRG